MVKPDSQGQLMARVYLLEAVVEELLKSADPESRMRVAERIIAICDSAGGHSDFDNAIGNIGARYLEDLPDPPEAPSSKAEFQSVVKD